MTKNKIIVGDLHGDIDIYRKIKDIYIDNEIILVGDYVDSFNKTRKQQYLLLEEILKDVENKKTIALKGNHELSYLYPDRMGASGRSNTFSAQIMPLFSDMHRLLLPYYVIPDHKILITHAGMSKRLVPFDSNCLDDMNLLTMWLDQEIRSIDYGRVYNIGEARGGVDLIGGIFWCDYQWDFTPIDDIIQIFGHTPGTEIRQRDNNYNIDCLQSKKEVLEILEDGSIRKVNLEDNSNAKVQ